MRAVAIVAVRGGSKGIPRKALTPIYGVSLLDWTLSQLKNVSEIEATWVISDDVDIQNRALSFGCKVIVEPASLAQDDSRIEDAWSYALDTIEYETGQVDVVVAPQITSPIRYVWDFCNALALMEKQSLDSLFSASPAKDLCLWQIENGTLSPAIAECLAQNRKRQNFTLRIIENGSFYMFRPWVLRHKDSRFGGSLGVYMQKYWQMFELDTPDDIPLCEATMKAFLEGKFDE